MVSVIVPVYNVEAYLPRCIESICGQTLSDLEIILVDDGSTDRSGEICDEYAQRDDRISVIHKENGGHTSSRNEGLKAARGKYIGFVDSDDWIDATMYEDMLSVCTSEDADIVISNFYFVQGERTRKNTLPVSSGLYQTADHSMDQLLKKLFLIGGYLWNKLFKKDLLCKYQFGVDQRITFFEDEACTFPYIINADRVAVMDQAYYHYRRRVGSILRSTDERYFEWITYLYQRLKEALANHPSAEVLMRQLNLHMLECVVGGINETFGLGFGIIVPHYLPPVDLLQKADMRNIILYGAGAVGQGYYRLFQFAKTAKVIGWVDRGWEQYRDRGLPVQPITALEELDYDGILIAIKATGTAEMIRRDLLRLGVPESKIWYEPPERLSKALDEGRSLW